MYIYNTVKQQLNVFKANAVKFSFIYKAVQVNRWWGGMEISK